MHSIFKNYLLAASAFLLVGSSSVLAEASVWGIDNDGDLYGYNVDTDTWTFIGATTIPDGDDMGLAYSPTENVLYAVDEDGLLYSVNPADASTTLIGDTGLIANDGGVNSGNYGAAFMEGILYVAQDDGDALYIVDTATAGTTLVAAGIGQIEALAPGINSTDPLFAFLDTIAGTLTRDSGLFTALPGEPDVSREKGLALAGGLLYSSDDSVFGSIDPITGEIVELAAFPGNDLEGLAGDGSGATSPLPVPTLPLYGLFVFAGLLALFGWRKL